ncbi:uncharacterized protein LOC106638369 [Copidosoma floridanum]|uniref:uncharacterized protein LOC106638369 n=1 Tax=Copidosoma floridanum TaxID=29053 RepID=UPI0006C9D57A|nr:uncharacterized protein LOC106638369 [Copidosoma floridanum]
MSHPQRAFVLLFAVLAFLTTGGHCIKCYQCSSDTDPKGVDNCGAYKPFDKEKHYPVECNSDESKAPGTFCVKVTQQGPRGFIWDGRWRQVIRRCASVASTGVTGVCNWGVYENGDYWEECSCSGDGCNAASRLQLGTAAILAAVLPTLGLWRIVQL